MRLYRPQIRGAGEDDNWAYLEATADYEAALAQAREQLRKNPDRKLRIDAEEWPELSRLRYHWHRWRGTSEGFGTEFMNRHSMRISSIETVWDSDSDEG